MLFVSYGFIAFLIAFIICYYTVFKRFQWQFLLFAGLVFYFYAGKAYLIYMALVTAGVWFASLKIDDIYVNISKRNSEVKEGKKSQFKTSNKQKKWLYFGLIFSLGTLIVVKYADFVIANINLVSSAFTGGGGF